APGRVEFIGNHTDYNGGAVLGAAIDRCVTVAASPNPSGRFRLQSTSGAKPLDLAAVPAGRLTGADSWANYPLGVWKSLGDFKLPQPAGFDLLVASDLPSGAGLSSSAALELSTALALLELAGSKPLPPEELAKLGRHAENTYVGVPCGILDQGTSAFGRAGQLVHIDCRGPTFSRVPLPAGTHLWIFNTKEKHALIDGLYATRHRECLEAAKALGVALLADLTPALDRLVDLLEKHPAVHGARLTGGGFGGAVMALTGEGFTQAGAEAISAQATPRPEIIHLQSADGAALVR
ncbi:MAG: galactokinase family protein, partial [Oleiharenicola lentus]